MAADADRDEADRDAMARDQALRWVSFARFLGDALRKLWSLICAVQRQPAEGASAVSGPLAPIDPCKIATIAEWNDAEARLWYDAWKSRGLSPMHMSPQECEAVLKLEERYKSQMPSRYHTGPVESGLKTTEAA